jgi:hypothetical protein
MLPPWHAMNIGPHAIRFAARISMPADAVNPAAQHARSPHSNSLPVSMHCKFWPARGGQ